MLRIVFLFLCLIPALGPQAFGSIEIYAKGHKYDSIQEYLASKKLPVNSIQESQNNLSDPTRHRLCVLGVENGIVTALQDFYEPNIPLGVAASSLMPSARTLLVSRKLTVEQLQEAIQQAVTASKYPKLLISEPGKVRIMALTTEDSK
jgi:hypothetical protein